MRWVTDSWSSKILLRLTRFTDTASGEEGEIVMNSAGLQAALQSPQR